MKAGLIDKSRRGVWALTEEGRATKLDHAAAVRLFQKVASRFRKDEVAAEDEVEHAPPDEQMQGDNLFREQLVKTLRSLSPGGFERLCRRVLLEVGFEDVNVTRQSGDGGIDGYGILRINKLISDRVLFQCKRHAEQISPAYIREFRGSMSGRADRGIFLATSTFSAEAKREARRDGAVPIEMVDLDSLISLLAEFGLGVKSQTVLTVDQEFFREYMPLSQAKDSK
jgi:restriction system protein